MGLTWKDIALWIGGLVTLAGLFAVLILRGRARRFPFFTAFVGFVTLEDVVLFFVIKHAQVYTVLYWTGQVIELVLQLAVVVEIARHVFRPFGKWVEGTRSFWIGACGVSLIAALALTFAASPHAPSYAWAWVIKANFFAVMLICMTSIGVLVTSRRFGLGWRNHVMGLAQGWTFWAFMTFVVETFHSYFGYTWFYERFAYVGMLSVIAAQIYWIFIFWQAEPSRVLSPEMHQILVERQQQLEYYVGKVVSRPGSRRSL
jgi:hypothetical protein